VQDKFVSVGFAQLVGQHLDLVVDILGARLPNLSRKTIHEVVSNDGSWGPVKFDASVDYVIALQEEGLLGAGARQPNVSAGSDLGPETIAGASGCAGGAQNAAGRDVLIRVPTIAIGGNYNPPTVDEVPCTSISVL
jgi:hypothetical protein